MPNIPRLPPLDLSQAGKIQDKIDNKTKPPGSLGQLETMARQLSLIQNTLSPIADSCELLLFAGDHGIAAAGVSAFPAEVTRQMVLNFAAGGAAANVFARQHGIPIKIVDTGVTGEPFQTSDVISKRVGSGTNNFLNEAAMSESQLEAAIGNGLSLSNTDASFVAFGEMGIGNTSSAALLVHKLTDISLELLVGRGTGLDDEGLAKKFAILEQAAARTDRQLEPLTALQQYGGFEIATMCGAMFGAASKGKALLIDGYIATAGLFVAAKIQPEILDYSIFCHASAEPGHAYMLEHLNSRALLNLDLRLGEGTGALLAWPLVQSACDMMNYMASFTDAGVSNNS